MDQPLNIVFMGTPDFAVPTLEALHHSHDHVRMVVTQPDRPKGRGRKVVPSPVKQAALEFGYPVFQPESIKMDSAVDTVRDVGPDVLVVVAFGQILPQHLLSLPRYGAINVHASLLPQYRGPGPIQWAIIRGEARTGVTTMLMDRGMDTGDILFTKQTDILPDDTASVLHERLSKLGADLLLKTLHAVKTGTLHPTRQDHSRATYAPMLKKTDGQIDWQKSAAEVDALVRGVTPWPGAFTYHGDTRLKIIRAAPLQETRPAEPGTVIKGFPGELRIATGNGIILIHEIQSASGKKMQIEDFLRGHPIPAGTLLG